MRALVTGGCGFVGKYLALYLHEEGDEVLSTWLEETTSEYPYQTTQLDIIDPEQVTKLIHDYRPEVVYHLAGIAFVPEAESNFGRTLSINVGGLSTILAACHLLELNTKVLFVSSAEVYGRVNPDDSPLTEESPVQPAHNYSLSKAMAELAIPRYGQFGKVQGVIARPFNHIGPGQDSRFVTSSFAKQLAEIKQGKVEPVLYVGNLEAKRDFSDVRDIIRGYKLAAEKGSGTFNFGSGRSYAIQEILDILLEICGFDVEIRQDPSRMRASEVPEIFGSYEKAKKELGWEPNISLKQSLEDIYASFLSEVE